MKIILSFLFVLISISSSYCQESSAKNKNIFEYKWLNKKFPIDTLISYEGDSIFLFNSEKRYVISFWYTYCVPCIAEIEWLNKLKKDFLDQNIEFIAISFDSKEDVNHIQKSHPFNFKLCYLNNKTITEQRLTLGYPTNLFLDEEGMVLFQKSGGHSDKVKAKEIYDLLAEEIKRNRN